MSARLSRVRAAAHLLLFALLPTALVLAAKAEGGHPGPEDDRQRFIEFFSERFPGAPLEDYVYGAMLANPDARAQYEQIMEFPPFLGDIDKGKAMWEKPFVTASASPTALPTAGVTWRETIPTTTRRAPG